MSAAGHAGPARAWALVALAGGLPACGARSGLDELPPAEAVQPSACPGPAPTCVLPSADPCGEATAAPAACVDSAWACPPGGRPYARAPSTTQRCLPFRGSGSTVIGLGPWGLGDFARVPTDDGRCLWVSSQAVISNGLVLSNVALEPDLTAPFGTCPAVSEYEQPGVNATDGPGSALNVVQITGGYRLGGATHVLYRVFEQDSGAMYGLTNLGGGVGRWNQARMAIELGPTQTPLQWGPDLSLGDAMAPAGDGEHEYVWGCTALDATPAPTCTIARLDAADNVEVWSAASGTGTTGTWIPGVSGVEDAPLFGAGSWISSVIPIPSGFMHVYTGAFGNSVLTQTASAATASWADGPPLTPCDLPTGDPGAFCAGAVVHPELADPTVPNELVVSYSVGTTTSGPPAVNDPASDWPRLVWVR